MYAEPASAYSRLAASDTILSSCCTTTKFASRLSSWWMRGPRASSICCRDCAFRKTARSVSLRPLPSKGVAEPSSRRQALTMNRAKCSTKAPGCATDVATCSRSSSSAGPPLQSMGLGSSFRRRSCEACVSSESLPESSPPLLAPSPAFRAARPCASACERLALKEPKFAKLPLPGALRLPTASFFALSLSASRLSASRFDAAWMAASF
mmetsp:Transcript_31261/g.99752  ORF Transcript_31261/g.99752 Transcript_31261/m.99752 type:complete len:209 (-) Transcript_31261:460-1086(-)